VLLRPDLDMAPACAARLAAGRRSLAVLKYFLWDFNVSLGTRAMVLKACLVPTLLAGSEVWGCSEVLLQKAQVALNEGVRSLYRFSPKSPNPPLAPAMRELHLQPVKASVLFRQCSLLYRTSLQAGGANPSFLNVLLGGKQVGPARAKAGTWCSRVQTRLGKAGFEVPIGYAENIELKVIANRLWTEFDRAHESAAMVRYVGGGRIWSKLRWQFRRQAGQWVQLKGCSIWQERELELCHYHIIYASQLGCRSL